MARLRTLLVVSLIGLAAIVMLLHSDPVIEKNSGQRQAVSEGYGLERLDADPIAGPDNHSGSGNREARPTYEGKTVPGKFEPTSHAAEQVSLSGWVATEVGEQAAGETVILYSSSQKLRYSTVTGVSGGYRFAGVRPGWDYVIKVTPPGLFESYVKSQVKLSSEQEEHNIILKPLPLGLLTGNVVDPYQRPVAGIELFVTAVEKEYWTASVVTDMNGGFSLADFPKGKFQIAIKGEQTLKATGLEFDPGSGLPVILTVDLGPYILEGGIYDESGQTFDDADVYLIWTRHDNGVRIRSTRKTSASASGKFQFTGLGPGKHELVVSAWRGGAVKKSVNRSVNVGVDSGELIIAIDTL